MGPARIAAAGALAVCAVTITAFGGSELAQPPARERVVGLPCEDCEAVFVGLPSSLPSTARIARETEPGDPLQLRGRVLDRNGTAVADVIVYAYQTDRGASIVLIPR